MIRLLSFMGVFLFAFVFKLGPTWKRLQGPSNGLGSVSVDISKPLIAVCSIISFFFWTSSGRLSCQSTLLLYSSPFTGYQLATSPNSSHLDFNIVSFPSCHVPPCCFGIVKPTLQFHNSLNPSGPVQYCCLFFLCKHRFWRAELSPPIRAGQVAGLHQSQSPLVPADTKQPHCALAAAQPPLQLWAQAFSPASFGKVWQIPVYRHTFTYVLVKSANLTVCVTSMTTATQMLALSKRCSVLSIL